MSETLFIGRGCRKRPSRGLARSYFSVFAPKNAVGKLLFFGGNVWMALKLGVRLFRNLASMFVSPFSFRCFEFLHSNGDVWAFGSRLVLKRPSHLWCWANLHDAQPYADITGIFACHDLGRPLDFHACGLDMDHRVGWRQTPRHSRLSRYLAVWKTIFPFGQSGLVVIDARNSGANFFPSICEDTPCKSTTTTQKIRLALIFNR